MSRSKTANPAPRLRNVGETVETLSGICAKILRVTIEGGKLLYILDIPRIGSERITYFEERDFRA